MCADTRPDPRGRVPFRRWGSQEAVECGSAAAMALPRVRTIGSRASRARRDAPDWGSARPSPLSTLPPLPNRVPISSRGSGRGASHHKVHVNSCDHTFSSPRTLHDPAAAVRGPRSVLGWVLFGQTVADPRIHRSAARPGPSHSQKLPRSSEGIMIQATPNRLERYIGEDPEPALLPHQTLPVRTAPGSS